MMDLCCNKPNILLHTQLIHSAASTTWYIDESNHIGSHANGSSRCTDAPNVAENVEALANAFKNVRTHREKRSKTPDLLECAGGARLGRRCERR